MMTNLFSIFDPSSNIMNMSLNWMSSMIGLLLIPPMYWLIPSRYNKMWNLILNSLHNEFKILLSPSLKGSTLMFISMFSMILFNNFMGLFPYIFTSSSHLIFTLTLSLPLWMGLMLNGWLNFTNNMFSHLIPQGTPPILMPFMVCIETISNIIRPMTLAIRLTANMIAGHLLMTLLSSTGNSLSNILLMILILTQIILMTLESAVSIIQSYVFSILMTLYSSEIK
uniref:ATP synthase subunit a n=1 Tax=Paratrichobius longicrus TaxID=402416 RepID=A0A5B9RFL8_9MUSC|nr:ATP synthase F0 subunit 6 [Paratrichobius longicrus]QEG77648.1 ATP synthase F0 subunit 6 [Paratrichobius longicrus]